VHNRGEA